MKRFGADRIKNTVAALGLDDMEQVRSRMFSRSVESAQKKVEGNNYDMRKNLLDYDNIVSEQRKTIYARRNNILDAEDVHPMILDMIKNYIDILIEEHIAPEGYLTDEDLDDILDVTNHQLLRKNKIHLDELSGKKESEVFDIISEKVIEEYEDKISTVPKELVR